MPKLSKVVKILEDIAPPSLADPDDVDKIGLVLDGGGYVESIGVAVDPTLHVFEEAARLEVDLLICHHPLIYYAINRIDKKLSDKLKIALENELSIYIMHTNYDRVEGGINTYLADALGLLDTQLMSIGCIGEIDPMPIEEFAGVVSEVLGIQAHFVGNGLCERVAVIGGSGFHRRLMDEAIKAGADTMVSGELGHHVLRDYSEELSMIDGTHYYTELPGMKGLCERLPVECILIEDDPKIQLGW
ncbi:MAG: Nif3-like dinuclear metal center hexameric protein [Methermicoccaceae archaeon]